jgi:hypothetical protein
MAPKINDLGFWTQYEPSPLPDWALQNPIPGQRYLFLKRDTDGMDWYKFRMTPGAFTLNYLLATTSALAGDEIVQGVHRDRTTIAVPQNMRVIEIEDLNPNDPTPWKAYEQKVYDPKTKTISAEKWAPPVLAVRDYQFAGQANAEGIIDDEETDAWITVGTVPQKLIDAVKAQNLGDDRERRVLLFLKGTTTYPRNHELTPILAASFGKNTTALLDKFFLDASKR